MTLTEYYDIICEKLGVDSGELTDKLRTTYLDAICEKLGIDVGALPDKIRTTYLDAICKNLGVDANGLQDRLVITYLGAILEKKGVDVDALPDRLLNTYLDSIVSVLGGGSTGGSGGNTGGVDWSQYTHALYNGVRLPKIPEDVLANYPYVWIRDDKDNGRYDLVFATGGWYRHSTNMMRIVNEKAPRYTLNFNNAESGVWAYMEENSDSFGTSATRTVLWSNFDIPNGSPTATDIYLAGTDPVPTD